MKNAAKKNKTSDIVLVFFPIVSRTGTDIDAAMKNIESLGNKPVILVVLHHTFDPEAVVSDSSKFVNRDNTLTVDCLFYEDKGLLECKRNNNAVKAAAKWLKSKGCKDAGACE
ncbi:Lipid-A-disaccharide synthase [Labeo rohita]|uniref:Lipid-A-disaccharide synthase n=1 Tax=Labeo rohita TaxID=84645 RepID=A0ABQ8MNX6_LABRO|nr:Lipid-A-disaccharide synthase [Labeo rohita]